MTASDIAPALWAHAGLDPTALERLRIPDSGAVLPSTFAVTEAAAALVGTVALAVGEVAGVRSARPGPEIAVDPVHAALAFQSERHLRFDDSAPQLWDQLAGYYRAGGGWVQFHTNFVHHRRALLDSLGLDPDADRDELERAVAPRDPVEVERVVSNGGGVAAALRTLDEWALHPHASFPRAPLRVESTPGAPRPLGPAPFDRPLAGLRVLDLTRIIAGPVCGRTLAAFGADVLRVGAATLPVVEPLLADTTLGKRFCHLDLTTGPGRDRLLGLAATADVVVTGFRPGALAGLGLAAADLRGANPDLVIAELSAFGTEGPWATRRGFDSITQSATGIVAAETRARAADRPTPLPCQLLDHGAGHLLALGVLAGLLRRHHVGGGHQVSVSLLGARDWLVGLGRRADLDVELPSEATIDRHCARRDSPWGPVRHVRHPDPIDGIGPQWTVGPREGGADPPVWARND